MVGVGKNRDRRVGSSFRFSVQGSAAMVVGLKQVE